MPARLGVEAVKQCGGFNRGLSAHPPTLSLSIHFPPFFFFNFNICYFIFICSKYRVLSLFFPFFSITPEDDQKRDSRVGSEGEANFDLNTQAELDLGQDLGSSITAIGHCQVEQQENWLVSTSQGWKAKLSPRLLGISNFHGISFPHHVISFSIPVNFCFLPCYLHKQEMKLGLGHGP